MLYGPAISQSDCMTAGPYQLPIIIIRIRVDRVQRLIHMQPATEYVYSVQLIVLSSFKKNICCF